ncbi:MAG: acyl carrier protein [Methylocystis sp.]
MSEPAKVHEKVEAVFKEVLKVDPRQNREALIYNQIPGWDSVAHMTLVSGLEEAFDCMLEMDDILDLSSYDKALEIMAKYA